MCIRDRLTSLFKIVVPDRLKDVLNTERAKKNFELLRQRADILKKISSACCIDTQ